MKNSIITGKAVYLIAGPKAFLINLPVDRKIGGHSTGWNKGVRYIWPDSITADIINPRNLRELKTEWGLTRLLIIDRISGIEHPTYIADHVNRSGMNFLIGRTPYESHPQFPDISRIYQRSDDLKAIMVHTVGPHRFGHYLNDNRQHWSEGVALCAPVAHYIGLSIDALGLPTDTTGLLEKIENRFIISD